MLSPRCGDRRQVDAIRERGAAGRYGRKLRGRGRRDTDLRRVATTAEAHLHEPAALLLQEPLPPVTLRAEGRRRDLTALGSGMTAGTATFLAQRRARRSPAARRGKACLRLRPHLLSLGARRSEDEIEL